MEQKTGTGLRLVPLTGEQLRAVYQTYMVKDFPKAELPPLRILEERVERGIYDCLGLYEDGQMKAYGHLVRNRPSGYLLLDFLAVCPEVRGGGYGSHFLQQLKAYYCGENGILLECESERAAGNEEEWRVRQRRIHFYQKNGCRVTRTKEILFGVEFDILYLPLREQVCQADREMTGIYNLVLGVEGREKHVKIWNRNRRMNGAYTWVRENEKLADAPTLLSCLGFTAETLPRIISFVGGGGKTTSMYQLADELAEAGLRVLVTTSTHIQYPEREDQAAEVSHVREICREMWNGAVLTAGTRSESDGKRAKFAMPKGLGDETEMTRLLDMADVILIEADGAKCRPVKIPEAWEPVIVPQTGLVIACVGLSSLGSSFKEVCFRFETKGAWLRRRAEDLVEPEALALSLMDERGGHKAVDGRYYRVLLNQADTVSKLQAAEEVVRMLPFSMQEGCAVTSYQENQIL